MRLAAVSSTPSPARYLEVTVGSNSPMSPRQQILSVPYAANGVPPETVSALVGSTPPAGYLICNGAAVSRTEYARLFAVTGTTYGSGNGSTTIWIGDAHADHRRAARSYSYATYTDNATDGPRSRSTGFGEPPSSPDTRCANCGGQPHPIVQPSIVLNYIVKY